MENMTFAKTSAKFGQWADARANTVYGLGFNTEPELMKVVGQILLFFSIVCQLSSVVCVSEVTKEWALYNLICNHCIMV